MRPNESHDLDLADVEDHGDITGDQQAVVAWCISHRTYEAHTVGRDDVLALARVRVEGKPQARTDTRLHVRARAAS